MESENDRTPSPTRRGVLAAGTGLALAALAAGGEEAAAASVAQTGWRFCPKCRGLFRSPKDEPAGVCPAGGKHKPRRPANNYVLYASPFGGGAQWDNWFRCGKCAGLVRQPPGGPAAGPCPKGGDHAADGPKVVLWYGDGIPGATDDAWDGCSKCDGLFNFAGGNHGVCPAGGTHVEVGGAPVKLVVLY